MQLVLPLFLLIGVVAPAGGAQDAVGASYQSKKALPVLQECLTHKLAQRGDVTAVILEGTTSLMFRESAAATPMIIDLAPPSVKVTTRFAMGTRRLVEACL